MAENVGDIVSRWILDSSNLEKLSAGLKQVEGQTKTTGDKLASVGQIITGFNQGIQIIENLGRQFANVAKHGIEFQAVLSEVRANLTPGEVSQFSDALENLALKMGKDTAFSAKEAAEGIREMVKGGLEASEILGGGLKGALDLAAAATIPVDQAATAMVNTLKQFNLTGGDAVHVADLFAGAANATTADVGDFTMALQQSGAQFSLLKIPIDDAASALGLMAEQGIKGSDAGTSMKVALQRLNPETKEAKDAFDELGLKMFDSNGQFVGMREATQQLHEKLGGLTQQERLHYETVIFGQDAMRAGNALVVAGAEGFDKMAGSIGKITASAVAAEKLNNLAGDLEQLRGSAETVSIQFEKALDPQLRQLTQHSTELVNKILDWVTANEKLVGGGFNVFLNDLAIPLSELGIAYAAITLSTKAWALAQVNLVPVMTAAKEAQFLYAASLEYGSTRMAAATVAAERLAEGLSATQKALIIVVAAWEAWKFASWLGQTEIVKHALQDIVLGLGAMEQAAKDADAEFEGQAKVFSESRKKMAQAVHDWVAAEAAGDEDSKRNAEEKFGAAMNRRLEIQAEAITKELAAEDEHYKKSIASTGDFGGFLLKKHEEINAGLLKEQETVNAQIAASEEDGWAERLIKTQAGFEKQIAITEKAQGQITESVKTGWQSATDAVEEEIHKQISAIDELAARGAAAAVNTFGTYQERQKAAYDKWIKDQEKAFEDAQKARNKYDEDERRALEEYNRNEEKSFQQNVQVYNKWVNQVQNEYDRFNENTTAAFEQSFKTITKATEKANYALSLYRDGWSIAFQNFQKASHDNVEDAAKSLKKIIDGLELFVKNALAGFEASSEYYSKYIKQTGDYYDAIVQMNKANEKAFLDHYNELIKTAKEKLKELSDVQGSGSSPATSAIIAGGNPLSNLNAPNIAPSTFAGSGILAQSRAANSGINTAINFEPAVPARVAQIYNVAPVIQTLDTVAAIESVVERVIRRTADAAKIQSMRRTA